MKSQQLQRITNLYNQQVLDYLLDDGKRKLIKKARLFYTSLKVECILKNAKLKHHL